MFKYEEGQYIQQKMFPATPECLWIDISWTSGVVSQHAAQTGSMSKGDTDSTDHTKCVDFTPTSRSKHYLRLLSTAESDEDRHGSLAQLFLTPVVLSTSESDVTGAIDVIESLRMLDISFDLLKEARAEAGVERDNKTLSEREFETAHTWLRKIFQAHFMQNVDLQSRIEYASENYASLTRKQKAKMRNDIRNAFKVWKRSLLGNHAVLMAILRNGWFDTNTQQELITAVLQEQSNSGDNRPAEQDRKKLRRMALDARRQLKEAKKLAYKLESDELQECDLSWQQHKMLDMLNSGLLENQVLESNTAYGHGEGTKITSKEEAACLRMSFNTLKEYFSRDHPADHSQLQATRQASLCEVPRSVELLEQGQTTAAEGEVLLNYMERGAQLEQDLTEAKQSFEAAQSSRALGSDGSHHDEDCNR